MSKALVAWSCLAILTACQPGAPTGQQQTPSRASAVSPSPHSSLQPSPTAAPDLPLRSVTFSCRLPIVTQTSATDKVGGYVTFPERTYQKDPAGGLVWVGDGEVDTQAAPRLRAFGDSPFYDLAAKRWIPASPGQTAPDGQTYAYTLGELGGPHSTVIVVRVATGAQRGFFTMNMHARVDDFDGRYAYLVGDGVWRMDTSSGALEDVAQDASTILVRGGNLWVGRVNRADPSPPNASPARIDLPQGGRLFDSIAQVNLKTGTETTWIYSPGLEVFLLGLDAAEHPVVSVSHGPDFNARLDTVLVLNSPGDHGTHVSDGAVLLNHMQADRGRLWFGSDRGIYLWSPASGLQKVFASAQPVAPGGLCV
jgi:hypothetical protein